MTTKELLDEYFQGLAKKFSWEHLIANDFRFLGSRNMTESPVLGKENKRGQVSFIDNPDRSRYPAPMARRTRFSDAGYVYQVLK